MTNPIQQLKEWISKDDLEKALLGVKGLLARPFENEVILLESRYAAWKRDKLSGTAEEIEKRKIQRAFLDLLDELDQVSETDSKGTVFPDLVPISKNDLISEIVKKLSKSITIRFPKQGAIITDSIIEARGKILLDIPLKYELWMMQKIQGFYYHTDRSVELDLVNDRWQQDNINFGVIGPCELIICLVARSGVKVLQEKIKRGDWSGFRTLPRGIYPIKSIAITKKSSDE